MAFFQGLFWGVVIGVLVQTIILSIKTARTDWDQEVILLEEYLSSASGLVCDSPSGTIEITVWFFYKKEWHPKYLQILNFLN